jgi:hypothetical protein
MLQTAVFLIAKAMRCNRLHSYAATPLVSSLFSFMIAYRQPQRGFLARFKERGEESCEAHRQLAFARGSALVQK